MHCYYIDETGFTGEDLMAEDQPIFAQATVDFTPQEAERIIRHSFGGVDVAELKYNRLARNGRHYDRIVELIRTVSQDPARAGVWISLKDFALVTLIVDWWIEPLAHEIGLNLYKDGANLGMANMLYLTLQGFWTESFRKKILVHFQRMFRTRSQERFDECWNFVRRAEQQADTNQIEILRYLSLTFMTLGYSHLVGLPKRVLDIAIPGLVYIGHVWNSRHVGPWEVVHDFSSNMAKQKAFWDLYASPDLGTARFENPGVPQQFPMNVTQTRFGDSLQEKPLQICDVLAGASSDFFRLDQDNPREASYRDRLLEAGLDRLTIGGLWPSMEVTPEGLGMKGWDGNLAIEWVAKQMGQAVRIGGKN